MITGLSEKNKNNDQAPPDSRVNDNGDSFLESQYGGGKPTGWIAFLPKSWVPYAKLARLSPPAALLLIYFPHLFGALHAANTLYTPLADLVYSCILLLGASFFFSNAAHAWNDVVDAPIDKRVSRTKNRPIANGTIPIKSALFFTVSQALFAASFLLLSSTSTAKATFPTILVTAYYPWAKLHTYFAQVVLGFCLAWGIVVGSGFTGVDRPWNDPACLCLVVASCCWTVIYDTVYAHQDLEDDIDLGVKSLAVLFRDKVKQLLWVVLILMCGALILYGRHMETTVTYYIVTLGGCVSSLGSMIFKVQLQDKGNCWKWFSSVFWVTGASVALGLFSQYGRLDTGRIDLD
jgi:4-hydroxybenzoate polyprenyltransferase